MKKYNIIILFILISFQLFAQKESPDVRTGNKFYNSEVFEKLIDEETGLYLESPNYVYDLFKDEMNFGHIIQAEI